MTLSRKIKLHSTQDINLLCRLLEKKLLGYNVDMIDIIKSSVRLDAFSLIAYFSMDISKGVILEIQVDENDKYGVKEFEKICNRFEE